MNLEDKTIRKTEEMLDKMLNEGITNNNLESIYVLSKIKHIAKEDRDMNYGGRSAGYDNYGNRDYMNDYGRRGYDMKYRGHEHLDRMYNDYGRYMDNRSRYGAGEEADKSFHYMVKALEDFIRVLHEEADTPQQKQQLMQALQNSMR